MSRGFGVTLNSFGAQHPSEFIRLSNTNGPHRIGDGVQIDEAVGQRTAEFKRVKGDPAAGERIVDFARVQNDPAAKVTSFANGPGFNTSDGNGKDFANEFACRDYVKKAASGEVMWCC